MKCIKCNAELKAGAKFCTTCGQKVETPSSSETSSNNSNKCAGCGATLKPNSKFCTSCGKPVVAAAPTPPPPATPPTNNSDKSVEIVKHKLVWNIQRGEVARHISASEFMQYDSVSGVLINDGTTAYIKVNGKLVGTISGGSYDFVSSEELDRVLNQRHGGLLNQGLKDGWRFVTNLLIGKKLKDKTEKDKIDIDTINSVDDVIRELNKDSVFSMTLKLDSDFPLIFGKGHSTADEYSDYSPMIIKTKYLDFNLGVKINVRIKEFENFSKYYFRGAKSVTTASIAAELTPLIKGAVSSCLEGKEIEGQKLTPQMVSEIQRNIKNINSSVLYGVEIVDVVQIATSNEDMERFRQLGRELYLSEKELDYLVRTNDFKNRLTAVNNQQTVNEARSDLDLYKSLQKLNQDKLVADDEFEKFFIVLSREKRIREAKNEDEIAAALTDIRKTGMLRDEDVDNLQFEIQSRKYSRGRAFQLIQLKDEIEYRKNLQQGESELKIEELKASLGIMDLEIERKKKADSYTDERFYKEMDKKKDARMSEIETDKAEMDAQLEMMRKLKSIEKEEADAELQRQMTAKAQDQSHELNLADKENEKIKGRSAEEIFAINLQNMGTEAAAEYAKSFSAGKNVDQQRELMEQMKSNHKEDNDRLERMMTMMMQTNAANNANNAETLAKQQQRTDDAYDSALNYATRNNAIGGGAQPVNANITYTLHNSPMANIPFTLQQMEMFIKNGQVGRDAVISTSVNPNPMSIGYYNELAVYFPAPAPEQTKSAESVRSCRSCGAVAGASERFCENCGSEI